MKFIKRTIEKSVAAHFKLSVTGETVFFFRVWPFASSQAGYVVTSEEDIETLRSRLVTYYRWMTWAPVLGLVLITEVLDRGGFVDEELLGGFWFAAVLWLAISVGAGFLFMKFRVYPIVRRYQTAHPMMEYVETKEIPTRWQRIGIAAACLGLSAYGLWLLRSGETLGGLALLAVAAYVTVAFIRKWRSPAPPRRRG